MADVAEIRRRLAVRDDADWQQHQAIEAGRCQPGRQRREIGKLSERPSSPSSAPRRAGSSRPRADSMLPSSFHTGFHTSKHTADALIEIRLGWKETDDDEGFGGEVKEVAGMHDDVQVVEQPKHECFLGPRRRHAQNRRPPAFGLEERYRRFRRQKTSKRREIPRDSLLDGRSNRTPGVYQLSAASWTGVPTER